MSTKMTPAQIFNSKKTTIQDALRRIRRGGRIFIGSGTAEPHALSGALTENAHLFSDNPVTHILTLGEARYARPEFEHNFRMNALFIGPNVREAVAAGRADYTPIFLHEVPELFRSGQLPLDAALIQVSPPDASGYVSLGVSLDVVRAAAQSARLVIAQVNSRMPRTHGDSFLHVEEIDCFIEQDEELKELPLKEVDDVITRIGQNVAKLVKDGSTLQLGIGAIPQAVVAALANKNDLGVHTEMLSDGVMHLVRSGVITGLRKTLHPRAVVTSFAMGTRELYDWVDDNPHVLFYPSDYTNSPSIISQNDNMVAINSAISVDLTGQVCADSIGHRFYSGIGGQVDFMRGAAQSKGGRPIIALPSTARTASGAVVSRLVGALDQGAGVVTSRGDVHYVVTEYGIASLHGKSMAERALALIEIAHPDHRNALLAAAKERHLVHDDTNRFPRGYDPYPAKYEHSLQVKHPEQGCTEVRFRPIKASDERRLQEFFYSHSDETVRLRYGHRVTAMHHDRARYLTQLDYLSRLAMLGVVGDPGDEKIIAVGRYEGSASQRTVEIAFVVHEDWRSLGIAKHLTQFLVDVAREKGFHGVTAQMLSDNTAMQRVFQSVLGRPEECEDEYGERVCTWMFANRPAGETEDIACCS